MLAMVWLEVELVCRFRVGFELVSSWCPLVSTCFELVSSGFELVSSGFDLVSTWFRHYLKVTRGSDLRTRKHLLFKP